jgi:hypothetical protein
LASLSLFAVPQLPIFGVGEDHDLAGIARIGENLLIAGEGGVENKFTRALGGRTKAPALEDASVFQGEDCIVACGGVNNGFVWGSVAPA